MSIFKSIMQGLNEAIDYEQGELQHVKVDKITISELPIYTADKIKSIRLRQRLTQKLFAEAVGVSIKTVEAWESGKNTPSGCANRMLELLERDEELFERYAILVRQ